MFANNICHHSYHERGNGFPTREDEPFLTDDKLSYVLDCRDVDGLSIGLPDKGSHLKIHSQKPNSLCLMPLESWTGAPKCLALVKHQLTDCVANHTTCKDNLKAQQIIPDRLIRLQYIGKEISPRLVGANTFSDCPNYCSLSHCWGKVPILTLKKSTLDAFQSIIDWSALPKTFQEAMHLTVN